MVQHNNAAHQTDEERINQVLQTIANAFKSQLRAPILRTPADVGLQFEDVVFPALDGVPIEAWFIPRAGSNRLVIVNHPRGFNRYGSPSHLEPWKSTLSAAGNDIEVDFTQDYRILHDAGYNVLTYDLRHHGLSGIGNGIVTSGRFESRDVVGAQRYVRSREDLRDMSVGLLSRCLGCNSTMFAMSFYPDEFEGVRCLVGAQPLSPRFYYEGQLAVSGIPADRIETLDHFVKMATGFSFDQLSPVEPAKDVTLPTFLYQVRNDSMSKPVDVQTIFDSLGAADKDLFWIEGTTRRWDGYNYFSRNPQPMLDWFDRHME
ncbi:alpha/beta hydrolase family protein [Martelella mangrovi]|uniref:Alpha/beta hydrolase n=1 Tax=Martelella mangrovi TaxID=1397477 RepID=A0ABV2IC84_9HYPH